MLVSPLAHTKAGLILRMAVTKEQRMPCPGCGLSLAPRSSPVGSLIVSVEAVEPLSSGSDCSAIRSVEMLA